MIVRTVACTAALACALSAGADLRHSGNPAAQAQNRFAISLYGRLAGSGDGNLIVSPFSVSTALSMALAGARGRTATEMSTVLGEVPASPKYHADLAALINQILQGANADGSQLLNANGLWVQKGFRILPEFRNILRSDYRAAPAEVDFATDPEGSRKEINTWTERHTNGKIRELFANGALGADSRLVLSTSTYFYGKWGHGFRDADTHRAAFLSPSGANQTAEFMNQTAAFGYAEISPGQILEMPYAGTGLAFDILLPQRGRTVNAVEAGITPAVLAGWIGALEVRQVKVSIPKFRLESDVPLSTVLAGMGMPSAFNSGADFSGIDDRRDLVLSRVVHKAYVEVNEKGTEAAAASGVGVALISMTAPGVPVFRADRPFLFFIRDTRTGTILFAGRLMNPNS